MEKSTVVENLLLEISALRVRKLSSDKENLAPLSRPQKCSPCYMLYFLTEGMGRIVPPFRQLYQETISDLHMELKAALVDLGHKSAFDLLLKEAWNPEAAMGNSTLPTVCDKLNVMSTIHLRKLIATLVREDGKRDAVIEKLEERIKVLEDWLNEMKKPNDVSSS
jgi:hypothetical protein